MTEPQQSPTKTRKLLRTLATLGKLDEVERHVNLEAQRVADDFLARLDISKDKPVDLATEREVVVKGYVAREMPRYQKLAKQFANRGGTPSGRTPRPAQGAKSTEKPVDVSRIQEQRSDEINRIEGRITSALDTLRASIDEYQNEHRSEALGRTTLALADMTKQLKVKLDKAPSETVTLTGEQVRVTKSEPASGMALEPWGTIIHLGARRAACVTIHLERDFVRNESTRAAFHRAVQGVVAADVLGGDGVSASDVEEIEDWLHSGGIEHVPTDDQRSAHLSIYRGALLGLGAVDEAIQAERRSLEHRQIALEQRSASSERQKPAGPDAVLKRVDELCRAELERFLEDATLRTDEAKAAALNIAKKGAATRIRTIWDLKFLDTPETKKPDRESFCVKPETLGPILNEVDTELIRRCTDLGRDAAALWHSPNAGEGSRLIDGILQPLLSEHGVQDAGVVQRIQKEEFYLPVAEKTTKQLIEKHLMPVMAERSPALAPLEVVKVDSATIIDRVGRMPNKFLAPLAGLFVVFTYLGVGGMRKLVSSGVEQASGRSDLITAGICVVLVGIFWILSTRALKAERQASELIALSRARENIASAVAQALDAFAKDWLTVFRANTFSSLKDVMRRARTDLSIVHGEASSRWAKESRALQLDQAACTRRAKALSVVREASAAAAEKIDSLQRDLGKALVRWQKEDRKQQPAAEAGQTVVAGGVQ